MMTFAIMAPIMAFALAIYYFTKRQMALRKDLAELQSEHSRFVGELEESLASLAQQFDRPEEDSAPNLTMPPSLEADCEAMAVYRSDTETFARLLAGNHGRYQDEKHLQDRYAKEIDELDYSNPSFGYRLNRMAS